MKEQTTVEMVSSAERVKVYAEIMGKSRAPNLACHFTQSTKCLSVLVVTSLLCECCRIAMPI